MKGNLKISDLKAFVPAKDYELSRRFFKDLGFMEVWTSPQLTGFQLGGFGFLLQNFYSKEMAENLMLSLVVEDLDAWWEHLSDLNLEKTYSGVRLTPPADYPWGLREVHLIDPSGVLWHISQEPPKQQI
jgi:hypothetical protein